MIRRPVTEVLDALAGHPGYAVLALDGEQSSELAGLVGVKDSMDRLVLAAARVTRSRLLSADPAMAGFGVVRVWD